MSWLLEADRPRRRRADQTKQKIITNRAGERRAIGRAVSERERKITTVTRRPEPSSWLLIDSPIAHIERAPTALAAVGISDCEIGPILCNIPAMIHPLVSDPTSDW